MLYKNRHEDHWNRIRDSEIKLYSYNYLIFDKEAKTYTGQKIVFNKWCWEIGYLHAEN
jgi:hypothetical protein